MHFNYYFLYHLTKALHVKLKGMKVNSCFTQNKNELIIQFSTCDDTFNIKALLNNQTALLHFPESAHRVRKNSVELFKELSDKKVTHLRQFQNDRAFSIIFENEYQLVFKLHGFRANILLFSQNKLISMFKNSLVKDSKLSIDQLDRPIDQSDQNLMASKFDLKSIFPTFDKNCYNYLNEKRFDESVDAIKLKIIKQLLTELKKKEFYILNRNNSDLPYISLFKNETDECIHETCDPVEISNEYAYTYLSKYHFKKTKNKHLTSTRKKINQTNSYVKMCNNVRFGELNKRF